MSKLPSDAVPSALALLASTYEREGCPIQAIHCLQALVNRQLPPDVEAKARLYLGRLLLEHTFNFKEACSNLLKAQIVSSKLIGNYCLKYEIQDQLATCYEYLGEDSMEQQAYTAVSELTRNARNSSEWAAVCGWVCRLAQRAAAQHARYGRPLEAVRAAQEGLAFAEANGLTQQKLVFLLVLFQLALGRWDHVTANDVLDKLPSALNAAAASGPGAPGMDAYASSFVLLHMQLLQVLYMLRLGKVMDIVPQQKQPHEDASGGGGGGPPSDPDGPDVPPPPVLQRLEASLQQLKASQLQLQQMSKGQVPGLPYTVPGLPSLEPLVCLVCAAALRTGNSRPRLVDGYLQRGLQCLPEMLAAAGIDDGAEESSLPRQALEAARAALQMQVLLLQCRAQVALSKADLRGARDDLLDCQKLQERFPALLQNMLPGVHLLTGQYCVATGELAAAVPHFEFARLNAPSRPAAALAAALEAQVHLSLPQQPQQQADAVGPTGDVAAALAALGPFYTVQGSVPTAGGAGVGVDPRQGPLGNLEDAACLLASAACLAQQGELAAANQQLSRALKVAFKRLGHTQLTCAILNSLAPIFLAQTPPDTHSAAEAAKSSVTLSATAGDLWAEAQGKRLMAAISRANGENDRAAAEEASGARRQQRIAAAAVEAKADSGRHGYAAGWRLRPVV